MISGEIVGEHLIQDVKRIELPLGVRNFPILCKVSEDFLDEQSEKDPYNASVLFEDRNISLPQAH